MDVNNICINHLSKIAKAEGVYPVVMNKAFYRISLYFEITLRVRLPA